MSDDQTTEERMGYVRVVAKEGAYQFRRAAWGALSAALYSHRAGERPHALVEEEDNYGATILLDLRTVEAIMDVPPTALARSAADEDLEESRKKWEDR